MRILQPSRTKKTRVNGMCLKHPWSVRDGRKIDTTNSGWVDIQWMSYDQAVLVGIRF